MHRVPLTLAALALLAACQSQPDSTANADRFALADANRDGKLSREEVSDFLTHNVFEARDTNKDGKLTLKEWLPDGGDQTQRQWFKQRDTNRDGVVSLEEALAWGRTNQGWGEMMKEADTNGDGFISRKEADAYLGSKEGPWR